jgi:hypothetical protein
VSVRKMHQIWIQQCEAAPGIKLCYGLKAAFDYLVAETRCRAPSIRSGATSVRFPGEAYVYAQEIRTHIARVERAMHDTKDDDDLLRESPTTIAKRAAQFAAIKELLTATELGTS